MDTPLYDRRITVGLAILRLVLGTVFIAHGAQKLFHFGIAGVTGAMQGMGAPLPSFTAPVVTLFEFLGGLLVLAGLLTRYAAAAVASVMVGAILLVHMGNGFFAPRGVEFPLSLLAIAVTVMVAGPGTWSLDHLIRRRAGRRARTTLGS